MNAEANVQKKTGRSTGGSVKDTIPEAKSKKSTKPAKAVSKKSVDSNSIASRRVWPD